MMLHGWIIFVMTKSIIVACLRTNQKMFFYDIVKTHAHNCKAGIANVTLRIWIYDGWVGCLIANPRIDTIIFRYKKQVCFRSKPKVATKFGTKTATHVVISLVVLVVIGLTATQQDGAQM